MDVRLKYDELNRLTNMVDAIGTSKFAYNKAGQLISEDGPWDSDLVRSVYSGRRSTGRIAYFLGASGRPPLTRKGASGVKSQGHNGVLGSHLNIQQFIWKCQRLRCDSNASPSSRSASGTKSLPIPPWPMPSWIGWSTAPIGSR